MASHSLELAIIKALSNRNDAPTYSIRNTLVMRCYGFNWPSGLKTRRVLAGCRRAQKLGWVAEVPSIYAVHKCWSITDAGRRALEEG